MMVINPKPYKNLELMKYGEADVFTHKPIVREVKNPTKFTIRLSTNELYYLDENGYPTNADISLVYKPSSKVVDRKTFKMLLSRLRNERLTTGDLLDYVAEFMNELVSPKYMSISLNVSKPFQGRKRYIFTQEKEEPVIETSNALHLIYIDSYVPNHSTLTEKENEIYSTDKLDIVPVTNRDDNKYVNREIISCTFLNKSSGFPEFCNLRVETKVGNKTLDPKTNSFENLIRKIRYTYLTEEEFVNYVASILFSLNPKHFNIQCSFNPRGTVGYDIYFTYQGKWSIVVSNTYISNWLYASLVSQLSTLDTREGFFFPSNITESE